MSASLKIRWRKLSIFLWLAALVASFVSYFDPSMANKITAANAGRPRRLPMRTHRTARVAQFWRYA